MATDAAARETILSLRRSIAQIEGRLAETLDAPSPETEEGAAVLRRHGLVVPDGGVIATGAERLDAALGGGVPMAALTEVHSSALRDAASASGFALALAARAGARAPLLWIAADEVFREVGQPYAPGLAGLYGIDAARLLIAQAPKLADTMWIAEEAARIEGLSAVLFEVLGNPARVDLTATRRLHMRARAAGRPVFLIRHAARPEPTAAPMRLVVSAAPAAPRLLPDGPLAGSIGPPGLVVCIDKNRNAPPAQFALQWSSHDRTFQERRTEDSVPLVPVPRHRTYFAGQAGARVAFPIARTRAAGHEPSGEQYPAHRRPG